MTRITVAQVDFNLLVALDALLEENSVQAAAERLHVSAPAMSRTLTRIRRATGDDILVRSGRAMVPTPLATELRQEAHEIVHRGNAVLAPRRRLDLKSLTRVFTIRGHDALLSVLAVRLIPTALAEAPGVRLRFLAETSGDSSDLARGRADIEVGSASAAAADIAADTAGTDRLVMVLRAGHPLMSGPMTAERFAAVDHVTVSRRGRLHGPIDDLLAARGLRRTVIAAVPAPAAAFAVVARGDAVTVVADRISAGQRADLHLAARPLPFEVPGIPAVVSWHRRYDSDPAHRWLRTQVRDALRDALRSDDPGARDDGLTGLSS